MKDGGGGGYGGCKDEEDSRLKRMCDLISQWFVVKARTQSKIPLSQSADHVGDPILDGWDP